MYTVWARSNMAKDRVLVHLAPGIGNIVFATPLLIALNEISVDLVAQIVNKYLKSIAHEN